MVAYLDKLWRNADFKDETASDASYLVNLGYGSNATYRKAACTTRDHSSVWSWLISLSGRA